MANNNADSDWEAGDSQADTGGRAGAAVRSSPNESQRTSSTASVASAPPLRKKTSGHLVQLSPSAGPSPRTSRNTSPSRKDNRPQPLSTPVSTQPSAAAIQRALSAANVPQLQAGAAPDGVSKLPKAPKSAGGSGDTTPRWPTSPRLKSPPPSASNSRRNSSSAQKKGDGAGTAPSISVQSATPQSSTPPPAKQGGDATAKTPQLQTPAKVASRGPSGKSTLETVQENSADDTKEPSPAALKAAADLKPLTKLSDDEGAPNQRDGVGGESEKHTQAGESGSESAGAKSDRRRDQGNSAPRPKNTHSKSYTPLSAAKSRQQEARQNMTVETETVASIPQSALSAVDRSGGARNDNSGSVRLKPSIETIRPKKERKKPTQKARSQGTASSKADIFEARVANAVDEANSSDSEETFVYESNPPEPQRRARHHSRTPSVTSSHSVAEGQRSGGLRTFGDVLDERRVAGKRSMKFSNNSYNEVDSPDSKDGSVRSHQPRHFGRFGRGASQASMFEQDSPFTQASKLRPNHLNTRHSRPNSPRSPHGVQQQRPSALFGRKQEPSFDFDAEAGDDERAPLVGAVRTSRSGRLPRRIHSSSGQSIDEYYGVRREPRCGRFSGCLLGFIVFVAVVLSAVAFLVMSNRPLYDVRIGKIENVLASEQELMLDLLVGAVNPNALGITVDQMDVNIFAKSRHVGTVQAWKRHMLAQFTTSEEGPSRERRNLGRRERSALEYSTKELAERWYTPMTSDGVDEGTDPDDDLERDAQTMLLGRIFHFDQGLTFEGSPLKRHSHYSVGELRLEKPGNKTETGGSERWENVLQYPFDLIIRGVLKYQLPISSRMETAAVRASILVNPEDNDMDGYEEKQHIERLAVD